MTLVCVPIMVNDAPGALADADAARLAGADLVEYRIDTIFHGEHDAEGEAAAVRLARESPLPCIITCRAASEGGAYDGDDAARVALYEKLGTLDRPPRYIDIELATYARSASLRQKVNLAVGHPARARDLCASLILSAHDFSGRPAKLHQIIESLRHEPAAAVHKIAFTARSLRDNLELFAILRDRDRPAIALGMGEFGLMSRVLAPKFGGFLTFASLRDTAATAPGQPTIAELLHLYRFRAIRESTAVYGVIGWPVSQSKSPALHNAGFESVGHDGVYLPLPVAPGWEPFKATLLELLADSALTFRGASVTIPHKEHLVRLAREDRTRSWIIDGLAALAGAANTLAVQPDGSIRVLNTDAAAATNLLRDALGGSLAGRRLSIIGAGGVARGIAAGLYLEGAHVTIHARRADQAGRLARDINAAAHPITPSPTHPITASPISAIPDTPADALVNATPVGMASGPDPQGLPFALRSHVERRKNAGTVMDTVYNPPRTPLIMEAEALGLRTIGGSAMFIAQAAAQLECWTGRAAPMSLFGQILAETLDSPCP